MPASCAWAGGSSVTIVGGGFRAGLVPAKMGFPDSYGVSGSLGGSLSSEWAEVG